MLFLGNAIKNIRCIVQINHTGKGFLFLIFREIKLRKYSSFPLGTEHSCGTRRHVPLPVAHLTGPGRGAAPRPARCPAASRPSLTCGPAHGSAGTPRPGRRVLVVPSPPSTRAAGNRFRLKVRAGGCKTEAEAAPGRARGPAAWAGQLRSRLTLPPRPFPAPGTARTGAGQERPRG